MDISKDYYSVFDKKGGWMNMAYVVLGVGAVTVAVALLDSLGYRRRLTSFSSPTLCSL